MYLCDFHGFVESDCIPFMKKVSEQQFRARRFPLMLLEEHVKINGENPSWYTQWKIVYLENNFVKNRFNKIKKISRIGLVVKLVITSAFEAEILGSSPDETCRLSSVGRARAF